MLVLKTNRHMISGWRYAPNRTKGKLRATHEKKSTVPESVRG
jgi:hypothetical protein